MNRNKTLLMGLICGLLVISVGTSFGANRYFFSPETIKVGQGGSFSWQMMIEIDQAIIGHGFSILAPASGGDIFLPDTLFDGTAWTGTAAEIAGFTTRGVDFVPALDAFGGYALKMGPPGLAAGTYVAININGTISGSTAFGVYSFTADPGGNNDCTDEASGSHACPVDPGYIQVIPHFVNLDVTGCPTDSIPEDVVVVITAVGGCSDPSHTGDLTVTCDVGMPDFADFVVTGSNPYTGTLTLEPTVVSGPWAGTFTFQYHDNDTGEDLFEDCYVYVYDSEKRPAWLLEFKKTLTLPGQQHVCVPVFLSALEPVNAFEILFDYDPTAVNFVGVSDICSGCDEEIWVHPCDALDPNFFEPKSPLFNAGYRPEYFHFQHGIGSHPNWVRVVGIMDMDWPQPITPPFEGAQMMIFCVVFDVSPLWDGQEVFANFHITDCTDNTLADVSGYQLWGPNGDELPAWLNCNFDSVLVLWDGRDGCPIIGIRDVLVGDLNCNEIQCEVGDAVVFINYLVHGQSALCDAACAAMYGDPGCIDAQGAASDMNNDGYYWTIADLVGLLNCVNGYVSPPAAVSAGPVDVMITDGKVTVASDAEIGGAYFTIEYEGKAVPELNADMEMRYSAEDGVMHVVIYSMESRRIPAGTHTLFTLPGIKSIKKADLSDGAGNVLNVSVFTKPPAGFAIQKVVPNPIRERTADIFFSIPATAATTLKIYDAAGRVVTTLVDGVTKRGLQKTTWDARDFANGVYFCRLESETKTASKKIVLMK